ncbi:MAG: hypothetical protein ACFFAN_02380 [Promethearchaeota archaeon]
MDKLINEVEAEKEHMSKTLKALNKAMKRKKLTIIELAAIATFLQKAYNGMENIIKRMLKFKGISIPSTEFWHKDLLDLSINYKIISLELSNRINEYRAFRHFFIHGYGINLDKEKLMPPLQKIYPFYGKILSLRWKIF